MKLVIRHDPGRGRFVASIGGAEAYLLYAEAGARLSPLAERLSSHTRLHLDGVSVAPSAPTQAAKPV